MRRLIQSLLFAVAFLAVACIQVLGFSIGFECGHHDNGGIVAVSHCHSQENGALALCEASDPSACEDQPDVVSHEKASAGAELPAAATALTLPGYLPVLLAELPPLGFLLQEVECRSLLSLQSAEQGHCAPVPIAGQVARSIVLLV